MNKEELLENTSIFDDKDIFEKLNKNKELRDWFLVELNVSLQRAESVVANLKDKKELRCYKNAVTSLEIENQKYKKIIDKVSSQIKLYGKYNGEKCTRGFSMLSADFNKLLEILKEVK